MSYDPTIGRFLSEDPIAFEGGDANLYRYAFNNISDNTDKSGLDVYLRPYPTGRPWYVGGGPKDVHLQVFVWDPKTKTGCVFDGGGGNNPVGSKGGPYSYAPPNSGDIKIATGLSYQDEIQRIRAYAKMRQIERYRYSCGPNSNTFAHQLLNNAGIPNVPGNIPNAPGWSNPGNHYGGRVPGWIGDETDYLYDENGNPIGEIHYPYYP